MAKLVISFEDTRDLALGVARKIKAKYETINLKEFPDGELKMDLKNNPKGKEVVIVSSLALEPNKKIIQTILAGGIMKDYGAKKIVLVATYFPYLRQDVHFYKYDSFSSRYITKMFSLFDKVITIDPHLHRIKNMKKWASNFTHITANELVAEYIKKNFKKNFSVLGPDGESSQWDRPIAKVLGKEVMVLTKHRYNSRKIKVRGEGDQKVEENVILVDDIISTGKTLVGAIKLAKTRGGKKFFCIGIHGPLTDSAAKLVSKHAKLITSNTIPTKYSKIDVTPAIVAELKKIL
jgi:ribose-phosphate pyrophosphokinase